MERKRSRTERGEMGKKEPVGKWVKRTKLQYAV
jgi:hypothetical protein